MEHRIMNQTSSNMLVNSMHLIELYKSFKKINKKYAKFILSQNLNPELFLLHLNVIKNSQLSILHSVRIYLCDLFYILLSF